MILYFIGLKVKACHLLFAMDALLLIFDLEKFVIDCRNAFFKLLVLYGNDNVQLA